MIHMSHKWIIGGENEGLDHIGLAICAPTEPHLLRAVG